MSRTLMEKLRCWRMKTNNKSLATVKACMDYQTLREQLHSSHHPLSKPRQMLQAEGKEVVPWLPLSTHQLPQHPSITLSSPSQPPQAYSRRPRDFSKPPPTSCLGSEPPYPLQPPGQRTPSHPQYRAIPPPPPPQLYKSPRSPSSDTPAPDPGSPQLAHATPHLWTQEQPGQPQTPPPKDLPNPNQPPH